MKSTVSTYISCIYTGLCIEDANSAIVSSVPVIYYTCRNKTGKEQKLDESSSSSAIAGGQSATLHIDKIAPFLFLLFQHKTRYARGCGNFKWTNGSTKTRTDSHGPFDSH